MKHIFVHIGYPKAGSSALQTTLLASRQQLHDEGFLFPHAPSGLCNAFTAKYHHQPETLFPYCDLSLPSGALQDRMQADFESLAAEIAASSAGKVVLSSESLIGLGDDGVQAASAWLLSRFEQVTIVCYVRSPVPYASSLIQERVKQGARLSDFAETVPTGNFSISIPRWVKAFGKDRIIVRAFARQSLVDADVVADFASVIGYKGALDRTSAYENKSLSQAAVLMLSALHGLDGQPTTELRWLKDIPGRRFVMPPDILKKVEERSGRETDYLAESWGIRFAAESPSTDTSEVFSEEAVRFIVERIAQPSPRPNEPRGS